MKISITLHSIDRVGILNGDSYPKRFVSRTISKIFPKNFIKSELPTDIQFKPGFIIIDLEDPEGDVDSFPVIIPTPDIKTFSITF